ACDRTAAPASTRKTGAPASPPSLSADALPDDSLIAGAGAAGSETTTIGSATEPSCRSYPPAPPAGGRGGGGSRRAEAPGRGPSPGAWRKRSAARPPATPSGPADISIHP